MASEKGVGERSPRTAFTESWVCKLKSQIVQAVKDEDYTGASKALEQALQMAPKDELLKQVQMVLEERRALHSESDSDSEGDSESASDDEQEAGSPRQAEDEQGMQGGSSRISDTTLAAEAEGRQSSQTSEEETEDHESDDSSRVYDASFPKSVAADKGSFHMSAAERKELRGKLKEGIEDLKFRAMEAELKQKDPLLGLT